VAMSEILQEITVWKSESPVPNHIYLLDNNSNIIAYIKQGDTAINQLKSKIKLDKRYRKFIKVNHTGLSKLMPKDNGHDYSIKPNVRIFKVISGNHDYKIEVNGDSLSCTCIGYGYRGKCKHIEAVKSKL
jgi:SPX domain protein involved in polyphosphate accumulation